MRINHNLSALNAWRQITLTDSDMKKVLERLSSGLKINRASDDAAGLAISEKMRGQIKGLEMAVKNAQDAISLIQTAEGALNEVHSILQRMRELAVQAASDTNTDVDRTSLQAELDQLREEIDRIARSTEFNTMKLLDGRFESFRSQADVKVVTGGNFGLKAYQNSSIKGLTLAKVETAFSTNQNLVLRLGDSVIGAFSIKLDDTNRKVSIVYNTTTLGSVVIGDNSTNITKELTLGDVKFTFNVSDINSATGAAKLLVTSVHVTAVNGTVLFEDANEGSYVVEVGQFRGSATSPLDVRVNYINSTGVASRPIVDFNDGIIVLGTVTGVVVDTTNRRIDLSDLQGLKGTVFSWSTTNVYTIDSFGGALPNEEVVDSGVVRAEERWFNDTSLIFQIGANEGQNMLAGLDNLRAAALGLTEDTLKVTDQNSAERTIMVVDAAIHKVSSARAALGAVQNRLEHTIANLGVAAENLTAAESRIRDADMAKEMMQFTKAQILMQSGMSMLAQANTLPQNVLQLMRG